MKRIRGCGWLVSLVLCLTGLASWGGLAPESIALLVNANSQNSMRLANEYVALRGIPAGNVVYLDGVPPDALSMEINDFRELVLREALTRLNDRGLAAQIDAIAYSCGFPTMVDFSYEVDFKEMSHVNNGKASITGLTYLYAFVLAKSPQFLNLDANLYARAVENSVAPGAPLLPEEQQDVLQFHQQLKEIAELRKAATEGAKQDEEEADGEEGTEAAPAADPLLDPELISRIRQRLEVARDSLVRVTTAHPQRPSLLYNLACVEAQLGRSEQAFTALEQAMAAGWNGEMHTRQDKDLVSLRQDPRWEALLSRMSAVELPLPDTVGFASRYAWSATGGVVGAQQGMRYLLSGMLGVVHDRALTIEEAIESLRRSATADGTRPDGVFYFTQTGDVRSRTREWAVHSAVRALRSMGLKAEVLREAMPRQRDAIAGLLAGTTSFDWPALGNTLLPGSFCEHLTSFGAAFQTEAQTKCTEFLRHGAAGTTGTVSEPFSLQQKFPTAYVQLHLARGASIAEAVYLSVRSPYELLLLGDPLCQPYARFPEVALTGLVEGQTVKGPLELTPRVTNGVLPAFFQVYVDGRRGGESRPGQGIRIDTTTLPEGPHELTLVAVAAVAPQTRGRLTIPFVVANGDQMVRVSEAPEAPLELQDEIRLRLLCEGASAFRVLHNGRVVAETEAAGEIRFAATKVGAGPVRLETRASVAGGAGEIHGPAVHLTITAPAPAEADDGKGEDA